MSVNLHHNTCPHCLGLRCIHCREAAAQRSTQRRRSRLTDYDRHALKLLPRRPLRFAHPGAPPPAPRRRGLGTPVLPAHFHL
jgi:hypothetical protein